MQVALDDAVRFVGFTHYRDVPPTLYKSDSFTILREVTDLRQLRAGDRCVVGLNVLHKLWHWSDALCSLLTSWECLPIALFHHFIILDDVTDLRTDGGRRIVPLRADGKEVRIAEFSESFTNAVDRMCVDGYWPHAMLRNAMRVLASPARMHMPPLRDYLELNGRGVFRVLEDRTDEQRRRSVEAARALAEQVAQPTYNVLSANCEHLANSLMMTDDARWVSPQVPHVLWILFRICLQLIGLVCLYACAVVPHENHRTHAVAATFFHIFSTVPVGAQVQITALRTFVNLTQRRTVGALDQETFDYLMTKEGTRTVLVLALSVGGVCQLPRLVWDTGRLRSACILSMVAPNLANIVFNCVQQALMRLLLAAGAGVPVPRFDDTRLSHTTETSAMRPACREQRPEGGGTAREGCGTTTRRLGRGRRVSPSRQGRRPTGSPAAKHNALDTVTT